MSEARGDEALRALEREVAASGSCAARVRLALELARRGRRDQACSALLAAVSAFPKDQEARLHLGRFRGPASGPWSAPNADSRNTRLSPARGPRGKGKLATENVAHPEANRPNEPATIHAPLIAGSGKPYCSVGGRRILALTADGHAVTENRGASGIEWYAAERDGKNAWKEKLFFQADSDWDKWSDPHAAIAPDATIFGVTSLRKLLAIEPDGEVRFEHELPAQVLSLSLDAERERLYLAYKTPAFLSCRDAKTGEEQFGLSL
ncbi:hypothetical protein HY251_08435, partial [bacterium]|nr:hypothetical protein [bacterium]